MILTPLWHTEFLLDIDNPDQERVRILIDTWLSDMVVWDMLERRHHIRLDPATLSSIDAIYISHAHTDHLDPYTLIEIYRHASPILILPYTLGYLVPLFRQYIPSIHIEILTTDRALTIRGIEITGVMLEQEEITNEDDVMMIHIASDRECLFAEIDTVPPTTPEAMRVLHRILTRRPYETVAYIASRNELEWDIPLLDIRDESKRARYKKQYHIDKKESIEWSYALYEDQEEEDLPCLYTIPRFVRGFIGQGMVYPRYLQSGLSELSIYPLSEIASIESDVAAQYGYDFVQKALLPWRQYRLTQGTIEAGRKECPIGEIIAPEPISWACVRHYARWSLSRYDLWDPSSALWRISEYLDHRWLPYWSASPVASLRTALIAHQGVYRIGIEYGDKYWIYEYRVDTISGFARHDATREDMIHTDESYHLGDILDALDGRQDLYTNFWHQLDPKKVYRLWTCIGANLMNHDIVYKKYALHFERASEWRTSREWTGEYLSNIG
jgi:Beta-lactamase superfamily domain